MGGKIFIHACNVHLLSTYSMLGVVVEEKQGLAPAF